MGLQGWQWAVIALIILLLFGAPKLPKLARSMGESLNIIKSETKKLREDSAAQETSEEESETEAVEGRVVDPTAQPESHEARGDHQR